MSVTTMSMFQFSALSGRMSGIGRVPLIVLVAVIASSVRPASVTAQLADKSDRQVWQETVNRGVEYLRETGQAEDGSFSANAGPGVTALVATGLMQAGVAKDDPLVVKAVDYIAQFVREDGGIYAEGSLYQNYETSLAVVCLAEANDSGRFDEVISNAATYIRRNQWGMESHPVESSDNRYGGFGYGKHGRPDLSNTSFTIEALRAAGNEENAEAIERAIKFVSRSQNHPSEHNETGFAEKNPDGGFYYTPSGDGESKADTTENGGLRSYGSMTYAGLKSFLYAGVDKDDPRVQAAVDWIRSHYNLESNPGMGAAGLYYYYHVFAKALGQLEETTFVDKSGTEHNWKSELIHELAERQNEDGSWTNMENDRWLEGDPNLVTGYVLMALSWCEPE